MRVTAAVLMHVRVPVGVSGGDVHMERPHLQKRLNYLSLRLKLLPLDKLRRFAS